MEIWYNRTRNIFSMNIVDEVRAVPDDVAEEHGLEKGSMIGRYNKVKRGERKFICWFLIEEVGNA